MSKHLSKICEACKLCEGTMCASLVEEAGVKYTYPEEFPKTYDGIRFTADAMDCALPIAIDSHSGCSYNCLYCFSNNLQRAPDRNAKIMERKERTGNFYTEWNIRKLEQFLNREMHSDLTDAMYPMLDAGMPVQLGALGDPFDNLELHSGWAKQAIPLFIKYKVPVRIGTKGGLVLQRPEYLRLFEQSPDQFWFSFSIITNSDRLISRIDINAPNTTERLAAMKALTDLGCNASLRMRPFLPGVSDAYDGEPQAWKTLLDRAKGAGARAISFEWIFLSTMLTPRQKAMYQLLFRVMKDPLFGKTWNYMSNQKEACRRGNRGFKYELTHQIRDHAHAVGMQFGISDPHFKEWNDTSNCCGMPESGHKWFSNWSRRQMTEVLVQGRRALEHGEERLFHYKDWGPDWAEQIKLSKLVAMRNWHNSRLKRNTTFGDTMRRKWNNPQHPRGPYIYFGGALVPVGTDELTGDLVYKYKEWKP